MNSATKSCSCNHWGFLLEEERVGESKLKLVQEAHMVVIGFGINGYYIECGDNVLLLFHKRLFLSCAIYSSFDLCSLPSCSPSPSPSCSPSFPLTDL